MMAHEYYHKDKFRLNAKPKISKLILTEKQRNQLNYLFTLSDLPGKEIFTTEIWSESIDDQKNARNFLIYQGLPVDLDDPTNSTHREHKDPTNRWKIRWSDKKNGATLYQCSCGSDMQAASKTPVQKQRPIRQLYEFDGCLAFLRLEIDVDKKIFRRAHGYLNHSEACHRALPKKNYPILSININIRDMTELLVRTYASTNDILSLNLQFIKDQLGGRLVLRNKLKCKDEHFLITAFDIKDARRWIKNHPQPQWNVNVERSVHHNLQELFGPNSSDVELRDAIIYYKPRDHHYDYTFLILATEEQRLQAWKYGHQNYIILNGTFQTDNKKLQMYVLMVIDEYKRGVPIGYLLFLRPGNTDLIGASNHEYGILRHLLEMYKNKLSHETGDNLFNPKVAIIDFGFKERLACSEVWSSIYLVYSPFQVYQCWMNKINQLLGTDGDNEIMSYRQKIKKELIDMIDELQKYANENEIRSKIKSMEKIIKNNYDEILRKNLNVKILALYDGQLEFINYLQKDWVNELMHMWTFYGRKNAANILRIDVDSIPWTPECLEGFRRQFNPKRILRFQRKGHVLRLDVLAIMLVKCITPICNIQRDLWNNIHDILKNKKSILEELAEDEEFAEGTTRALLDNHINTIAFEDFDPRKKEEANLLKIKFIEFNGHYLFVRVQCNVINPEYVPDKENMDYYMVCLTPFISCHCFNFLFRGGACSHIRASINIVNWMRLQPKDLTFFDNLEHWEMPFIQLNSRQEAFKKLHDQKFKKHRKVFPLQNYSMENMDDESDSDSEIEDNVDFFDPYVNMPTRLDKWSFGVGTNSISSSTLTEGSLVQNSIVIGESSSTQQPSSFTNSLMGSTIRDKVTQSWNNELSFATNRLIANMNDLVTVFEKLTQNQVNIPDSVSEELKILDKELNTRLNTLVNCDKSKELMMTLWQMRQKLDSITNSRLNI
ncbi:uncharacterized protein OCT59_013646 [Rhizophagus irregularis]|uniref:SWIM-type domain-containing protein n=2 Tax=Rhizophagus irregularis TaxID=588596 RepID=U9T9H5_RHIID|nr:hypothetical protein GLOIN_2v1871032 [Rhizophagus irregularis DAOM 181602=DAOM 197198]POG77818.1 hypothetical protein GLOIN_2v1871032 [Rhizophagus irregularis DAOM 181602=DAOM 197198]UZO21248.1 hypothetical protein OCT59_013646 [Rhizophagus irregularis]GET55535.1 hypothetical protein RIR_jg16424.t1 [Rhizophagus irregularis DAOM 181602=DAOM 197198]CAG8497532.1 11193_t:CDS:2 [Rhizophagus irregularis]|eukprot:XP_025184684.1 hypothetical protein GLOIN_2v1871032 [Rhizophagus irregularis DAOM 181602=DAOM 197198]